MNPGIFLGFAPLSWRVGVIRRKPGVKLVLAFGPFRLALHNLSG